MENNPTDPLTNLRRRGRRTNAEIIARGLPQPIEPAPIVERPAGTLPPVCPMKCTQCGRGMDPRVLRTGPDRRWIQCRLCGGLMTLIYSNGGPLPMVQRS